MKKWVHGIDKNIFVDSWQGKQSNGGREHYFISKAKLAAFSERNSDRKS